MVDWNLNEESLGEQQYLQYCKAIASPHKKRKENRIKLQGMTNNDGLRFSVGDTIPRFYSLLLSKTIRIGDTKCHSWCSSGFSLCLWLGGI